MLISIENPKLLKATYLEKITTGKKFRSEKDIDREVVSLFETQKIYIGISKGFPDHIMLGSPIHHIGKPIPNGFIECKLVKHLDDDPVSLLRRPQLVWAWNLVHAGYNYYMVLGVKDNEDMFMYKIEENDA